MSTRPLQFLLLLFAGWANCKQLDDTEYLKEENSILREQLGDKPSRLTGDQRRRLAIKGKLLGRKLRDELGIIVTPDTILRWYRKLVSKQTRELVLQMARENPRWGVARTRGALHNLGIELGRNTISNLRSVQKLTDA